MRTRLLALAGGTALTIAGVWILPASLAGQTPRVSGLTTPKVAADVPRTADGKPDMQGFWNAATLTPLERDPRLGDRAWITPEEAEKAEREEAVRRERLSQPSRGDRTAPPVGGDGSRGAAGNVGGYNNFWIDRGDDMMMVDGQFRTSIVVDPPNGRVPQLLPEAVKRNEAARRGGVIAPTSDAPENAETREVGSYDDPEIRPLGERCIMGFGSTSGPPALPVLYNNIKQIVQAPNHVMVLNEMVHDARSIRLGGEPAPPEIRKWMGDSVGRWEGDTLVVVTTNFNGKTRFRGSSQNLKVTERFTRVSRDRLLYQFTVEDPTTWPRPWSGEYTWVRSEEPVYEYACHEHNYALQGILKGERVLESEGRRGADRW